MSKLTGVKVSTLRSWETAGLITPAKSETGRRTYDDNDVRRIQQVDRLRRVYGYSLKAVKHTIERAEPDTINNAVPQSERSESNQDILGSRVRTIRRERGMSLRDLSERSGLAASYMSMFERGAAYPSPARLNAIAGALGLTLANLLGSTTTGGKPIIRKGKGRVVDSFGPGVSVEQLTVGEQLMDCEIWTIQPGAESEGFYAHAGQELVHVLAGEFELAIDGGKGEILRAGDSAYFDSTRQHRWRNPGNVAVVVMWINTDPDRLSMFQPSAPPSEIGIGTPAIGGNGKRSHTLNVGLGSKVFRVVDTHTAGHPTRIVLEPLEDVIGASVREKRDDFARRFDHLRTLLLHEPRGHAATFGLFPIHSEVADFGAIFVSSYKYLDMCGHGTIGFARALEALGRLRGRSRFTLETPAGVVSVHLGHHGLPANVTIENVPSYVRPFRVDLSLIAPGADAGIAYGGCWYATVDARVLDLVIAPENVGQFMALGARIKAFVNECLARDHRSPPEIDSVLFHENRGPGRTRQLVVLEGNKFDRSPCGTGASARMAELHAEGRLSTADTLVVENVLGVTFGGRILGETSADSGPAILPEITGQAHLSGFSTLILEVDDPLPSGFLCR